MRRLLIVIVILLLALIGLEQLQESRRRATRRLDSTLRPLVDSPATTALIQVRPANGDTLWSYVLVDEYWRYPAYHDAYADAARIGQLLRGLVQSHCTVVSTDATRHTHYGLDPTAPVINVRLADTGGQTILDALIGRGAPGPSANECYIKLAAADTVYHLHANPRHALTRQPHTTIAPMLDPHVLPQALPRRSIVAVRTTGPHHGQPPLHLRRIKIEPDSPTSPRRPPEEPKFTWLITIGNDELECNPSRAYDYISFLRNLRYKSLQDPTHTHQPGTRLEIEDEEGATDILEHFPPTQGPNPAIHNHTTNQLCEIGPTQAALLFPPAQTFLDTTTTSPFRQINP